MGIIELIRLLESKLAALNTARSTANSLGNIEAILILDIEIIETTQTIEQLKTIG